MSDETESTTGSTIELVKSKRKPLRKPASGGLKKIKAKASKKKAKKKAPRARARVASDQRFRVRANVKPEDIRSKILLAMVKAGKRLKTFDVERLNKAVGKHLPTKSKDRQTAVISWRLRHSGLFAPAA